MWDYGIIGLKMNFLKLKAVRLVLVSYLAAVTGVGRAELATGEAPPNFIFFIADDISQEDLGCYGNPALQTPHLDRLAREGMVFENAYLTISSCSPSRCSIITGRYPHNTGAPELHTPLPAGQFVFPEALKLAGYHTVLSGKHHMGDAVNRAFDRVTKGKGPGKEGDWVEILRDRPMGRPFFCWFASTDAHREWQINPEAPVYAPQAVVVPPYLIDGPETRQDLANYYHEVSRTDTYVGKLLEELERQGCAEETYLIYCSDNGRPFPRCKTRLYDSGIRTPLIVWCPGKVISGRSRSLVSSIDLAATFLELAGLPPAASVQGVSLAPIFRDPTVTVRDYAFAEHNWHVYQAHERMVRFGNWLYIRNAWPDRQNLCVESDPTFPSGRELWAAREAGHLVPSQRGLFLKPQPVEELYDVTGDRHQLNNLIADLTSGGVLQEARALLDQWIHETGDSIPAHPTPDRQNLLGEANPGWKHQEFPGQAREAQAIQHPGPVRKADAKRQLSGRWDGNGS